VDKKLDVGRPREGVIAEGADLRARDNQSFGRQLAVGFAQRRSGYRNVRTSLPHWATAIRV
jgi:hypothetical protein